MERSFTISVVIPNSDERPTLTFPAIPGFTKRGTSASVTTTEQDGEPVVSQVITQTYAPTRPGEFRLAPFSFVIDGKPIRSEGVTLIVLLTGNVAAAKPAGGPPKAYLELGSLPERVYAGEGFVLRLSLLVSENYPYELRFTKLDEQLQTLLKRFRPSNAWEENRNIRELAPQLTTRNGQRFAEYRIYEATYFPLAPRTVVIPAVSITMLRIKTGKAARDGATETATFSTERRELAVQPLPPHPLRGGANGRVAVGQFKLTERIERTTVAAGRSVRYEFRVDGAGNIAGLPAPAPADSSADKPYDLLPLETKEALQRSAEGVRGHRSFFYYVVPKQEGELALRDAFQWVYFDPVAARYDTLQSRIRLHVTPGSTNTTPDSTVFASGSIYAGLDRIDSTERSLNWSALLRAVANVMIVAMLLATLFLFFRR